MTCSADGPEPRNVRAWLGWVVTERWERLVRCVSRTGYMNDPSIAPDLIHDAMLKILAGEVELPDDRKSAWGTLLVTVRNLARNHCRSEKVRAAAPLEAIRPSPMEVVGGRERGWRICERLESEEALAAAIEGLTPDRRELMTLRYMEQWTVSEIAEYRGGSPRTVRNLLSRALAQLRGELDGRLDAR